MKKFFKINSNGLIKEYQIKREKRKKELEWQKFRYLGIGFYLITPILLGLIIGLLTKKAIFFIFLGTIFTFYDLYKIIKE